MKHKNGDLCAPYVNEDGKWVHGSAAFMHQVFSVDGSVKDYNDRIGTEYVNEFVKQNSDLINEGLEKKYRRKNFKLVSNE